MYQIHRTVYIAKEKSWDDWVRGYINNILVKRKYFLGEKELVTTVYGCIKSEKKKIGTAGYEAISTIFWQNESMS